MKPQALLTGSLLAFVALSIGYLIVNETTDHGPAPLTGSPSVATPSEQPAADVTSTHTVVAYYFYGNIRCQTCRKLEAYTAESITTSFTNELSTGLLEWKTTNVDDTENEHFIEDYQLTSRAVVLVRVVGGKETEWKNLKRIWDLVPDKAAFQKYITDETSGFLKKAGM